MTKFIRQNYIYFILISVSIGVSIYTLFFQSIRLDEAQSIWVSTKSLQQILYLDAQDVLVPLYEILLHFWMQIFGNTIVVARSLSFIFFLGTIPVLYLLAKETSNTRVALITITLFSLSPFIMWYSSEARMYTLFALVTTANNLFFMRFVKSAGKSSKTGFFVTAILGLFTHYFFIFLMVTQFFYLFWRAIVKPDYEIGVKDMLQKPHRRSLNLFWLYIALASGVMVFFIPWLVYFIRLGAAANTQPLIQAPTSYNFFLSFVNFLFGSQSQTVQSILISLWPVFVLGLFFVFTKREEQAGEGVIYFAFATFLPVILIFLGSFFKPIFLTRYLILVTPTLFILIAWMFSGYHVKGSRIFFGILFSVMLVLLVYQNIATSTPLKENYAGVSAYLESHATPSDVIAVSTPFTIYPIEYTYQGNTKIDTIPLWDRFAQGAIPAYSQAKLIAQLTTYKTQYTDLYVVLSYDQGYEDAIKQYLDKHYKRLVLKEFSPGLELREYRLRYNTS
jgi:mannosyltransferase